MAAAHAWSGFGTILCAFGVIHASHVHVAGSVFRGRDRMNRSVQIQRVEEA